MTSIPTHPHGRFVTDTRPVALITGSARRLGAAIARRLHAEGYDLALHYRESRAEAEALHAELESQRAGSVLLMQADLAQFDRLPELIAQCIGRFGRLDALVNNASSYYATPFGGVTPAQWDDLFATNARAPFFLSQAAAPHLRAQRGAILNLADIYAERPLRAHPVYGMAKAALVHMTRALALELGPEVRVNAIAPGNILWSTNSDKAETLEMVTTRTPLARQGTPEEIAAAALFLLREATYCSGQVLAID
ncbi:MAG TPA: pteridine reductase, partial [Xanthomonadaceae bacterium]|nr:pteridine reductase [Xanthomonadaceae bacterium]